ncbi:uncharacterized protein DUF2357 [Kerstersia gyiorum]|uniref:Uncharacterized protein DUF2357 n=1 Tax=Kerstersia gyiorum TaxID=206506 RepID=A0A4Q7MMA6_9BURK|nr:DUF2357 domain-containing protein [Kerstersia gyiorum]KAB0544388.1 DUF2357 domain-containing protein [Kerstersia gyiorum]RZS69504.1 uncharacterized protein DUF2357 [Kerstersia gyiorum]
MIFLDRLTGGKLNCLPDVLLPGRYCLLEPLVVNGHSRLQPGDLLSDDGSGVIRIQDTESKVLAIDHSDCDQADSDLSAEAIVSIAGKIAHTHDANVSPMLPAEMAAQCVLEELERDLAAVLGDGHLHAISDRPRRDLRYDESVAPVARARRLAPSALSHLASHSDCWQQRTLSGVQPRKILARFSEDDYAIYENRLYKRLLDRLDRHLARRLARIRGVNSRLESALEFQDSEQTHFRLRQDICRLWGESYLDDKTGMQLEAGKRALSDLESQLRAIRGLKQRGLYSLVPPASVVPAQIHRTNILNHDPHYRHLPPLWERLKDDREERLLPPEERLARQLQLQVAYVSYVGLVIRRALERYSPCKVDGSLAFSWAGQGFTVDHDAHDWVITQSEGSTLRIVPIAWFGASISSSESLGSGRIVCWPGAPNSVASAQSLPVSPLDLYVVEKVGKLIDEWMLRQLLQGYGRKLGPLPTPSKKLTETWPKQFEPVSPTYVRLLAPVDAQQAAELKASLRDSANSQVEDAVGVAIEQVAALAQLCGHPARFERGQQQDFYCQCGTCQITWSLKTIGNKRRFSMQPKGVSAIPEEKGFLWFGRDWLEFDLDPAP